MSNSDTTTTADEPRPIKAIIRDLSKPHPERLLKELSKSGNTIHYIPWYRAQKVLNHYTDSRWEYEIVSTEWHGDKCLVKVRITIMAAEGWFHYDGQGVAEPEGEDDRKGYGDPPQRAEAQAFRRACSRTGMVLELYEGIDYYRDQLAQHRERIKKKKAREKKARQQAAKDAGGSPGAPEENPHGDAPADAADGLDADQEGPGDADVQTPEGDGQKMQDGDAYPGGVTHKTMKRMHAAGSKVGFTHDALHNMAAKDYGVESLRELSEEQAQEIVSHVEKFDV